jgi:hypothetical protein
MGRAMMGRPRVLGQPVTWNPLPPIPAPPLSAPPPGTVPPPFLGPIFSYPPGGSSSPPVVTGPIPPPWGVLPPPPPTAPISPAPAPVPPILFPPSVGTPTPAPGSPAPIFGVGNPPITTTTLAGIGVQGIKPYFFRCGGPGYNSGPAIVALWGASGDDSPPVWQDLLMGQISQAPGLANFMMSPADGTGLSFGTMLAIPEWWPEPAASSTVWKQLWSGPFGTGSAQVLSSVRCDPTDDTQCLDFAGACRVRASIPHIPPAPYGVVTGPLPPSGSPNSPSGSPTSSAAQSTGITAGQVVTGVAVVGAVGLGIWALAAAL